MERMGWTYEEYMNQPNWVIDLITEKQNIEGRAQSKH